MSANRVMYDGLYTFVLRILNMACAAGLGVLTARLLGPAGKGIYAFPGVEAGLVAAGFTGLGSGLSYFMLNRSVSAGALLKTALVTALLFLTAGAGIVWLLAEAAHKPWSAVPAILSLPGAVAVNIVAGYAVGIKRVRYSTTVNVAVTFLTLAVTAAGLFLVARSPAVAIAAWIAGTTAVAIVALSAVAVHARRSSGREGVPLTEFFRFACKIGATNLVSLLNYRADLYIVALFTTAASLGMYTVAVSAAESLLVPTQVAALVTSPHIGSLERSAAASLAARCVRNNLLVALVVCGALFAAASPVVRGLYGTAFSPVVPALQVLLVGVLALSLGSPLSSFFTLKLGRPEVPLCAAAGSALLCIGVSIWLVPRIGMLGAALGSTIGYAAGQLGASWYFLRLTGLRPGTLIIPTAADMRTYASFAAKVLADGRALLPPARSGNLR